MNARFSRLRRWAVAALLCVVPAGWAQPVTPLARTWAARDYGGGPINLSAVQHPVSGFIYVGNGRGVLEFDGVRWRLIPLPARGPARTLAVDAAGTVWVGSYNEIAVLRPDESGELRAVSLLDRVAAPDRPVEFVSQALAAPDGMWLVEQAHLFHFRPDGSTQVWKCPQPPLRAWWMDGAVHVALTGTGIFRPAPSGELVSLQAAGPAEPGWWRILAARSHGDGRTLLLTARGMAWWTSADRHLTPVEPATASDEEVTAEEVTAGDFLAAGGAAGATDTGTLLRFNAAGRVTARWPGLAALTPGRATDLTEDLEGGLWVSKTVGVARLQWSDQVPPDAPAPAAVLRRVTAANGQMLAAGDGLRSGAPGVFGAEHTTLRFDWAAPTYRHDERGRAGPMFRTRLDGVDGEWSEWTTDARRDYARLPLEPLRLHLQARDAYGREGPALAWTFELAPPWWRKPWAWAGLAGAAATMVAGSFRLLTGAHRRRAAQLEAIVAARTEDLRRSHAELARLREIDRDEKVAARLAEEKARLEVLRYQLNPHFLYNALNSLYSLVLTSPPAAADMVLRLADFCRVALERQDEDTTTVGSCFDRMALYLEIEKVRWGAGLHVEIAADPEVRAEWLPPFLVLPLLENAIKYGGATSPDLLRVRLVARRIAAGPAGGPALEIEVANTGRWTSATDEVTRGSTGIGLENLRQRLQRYYPERHTLQIDSADGWVRVRLRLAAGAPAAAAPPAT